MAQRVTVRERIDPAITASLFANYRSSADAVMELVDNAIDSRLEGNPLEVFLLVHPSYLFIETRGGEGMGPAELERHYLRWGGSPKRGRRLLGQYGQGGKAAIGHLGGGFTVEASRPGDTNAWRFNDPDYRDRSKLKTYELKSVAKRVAAELGYVRIRIDGLDKRLDPRRLRARLGDTYRPLILRADLKLTVNGARVEPPSINFEEEHRFAVHAAGATLRGWYGLAEPEGRGVDYIPGLRCYKLGRLITTGEFFGHPNAVQVSGMARLVGEIDLADSEGAARGLHVAAGGDGHLGGGEAGSRGIEGGTAGAEEAIDADDDLRRRMGEAAVAGAKAAGKSWEEVSAEKLYRPLGMRSTSSRSMAGFISSVEPFHTNTRPPSRP